MLKSARALIILFSLVAAFAVAGAVQAQQAAKIQPPVPTFEDREVLPIKPPYMAPITTMTPSGRRHSASGRLDRTDGNYMPMDDSGK